MSDTHVETIVDLLQSADTAEWTPDTDPVIKRYWDDTQAERGPGADQPAICYVWSPTGSTLEQFSMDGTKRDRTDSVEVQVWSLDELETRQLQADVDQILSGFLDDNAVTTPFSTVETTGVNDFREQTSARRTEHYIMSVEIDTRGLDTSGKA